MQSFQTPQGSQTSALMTVYFNPTTSIVRIRIDGPSRRRRYRPADERRGREILPASPAVPARGAVPIGSRSALITAVVLMVMAVRAMMILITTLGPALR